MNQEQANQLSPGLYMVCWKPSAGGRTSLAAIGVGSDGNRWLAPVNWDAPADSEQSKAHWENVERVTLLIE